jgi:ribosome-binding protein aMBF1 (putative translation factor)|tara:strand:- start:1349 stop:1678 length:330 start_codon:yes stop_codon:yes gene_type:complete
MEHQDWDLIILNNKSSKPKLNVDGTKKKEYVKSNATKLEENVEEGKLSHKKMDLSFGKSLQKYRLSQGLTQKDLSTKLNIPVKDINEIESGKAKHNGPLMGKIKRLMKL